jgi:hypothetical protein
VRKATEKAVARNVREESLDTVLSSLPTGVYGLEDSDGNELNIVTVKKGRVEYKECNGPRPVDTVLPGGAVVTFAPISTCRALVPVGAAW